MTVEKAEVKILTANSIGADIEDMLEQAQKAEHMHEGAKIALADAAKRVNALAEHLRKAIQDGEVKLEELNEPDKIEGLVRRYIARAAGLLENLHLMSQNAQLGAAGMVTAYKNAMKAPMKVMEAERKKMEAIKEAIEEQQQSGEHDLDLRNISARVTGQHPGDPLKNRRQPAEAPVEPVPDLAPARLDLIKQLDLAISRAKGDDVSLLQEYREYVVGGGDLRTKQGRELRKKAEPLLKVTNGKDS